MRIISSYKDYYDGGMSLDQDRDIHYVREKQVKDLGTNPKNMPVWPIRTWGYGIGNTHHSREWIVGFCNKIYPVFEFYKKDSVESTFCFTLKDIDDCFKKALCEKQYEMWSDSKIKYNSKNWTPFGVYTGRRDYWVKLFEEFHQIQDKHESLFQENKSPIFHYRCNHRKRNWTLTLNPCLKDIEFYRVIPVYDAYQQLVMFMNNMANPEKAIPAVDDTIMAEIKGFDKHSFRKLKLK